MYEDLVKELLKLHFGVPKKSLTLGVTDGDRRLYYYDLKQEKQITALRDLLRMKDLVEGIEKLPELKQSIPEKGKEDEEEAPQCVVYSDEGEGHWRVCFHTVTGVRYHRTRGNRIGATLQLSTFPTVILSDRDEMEFYGFWRKVRTRKRIPTNDRDGFSYWMNKALLTNEPFRCFAVDFFFAVGEAQGAYILKDVARAIANCGCFLPPISYRDLLGCRTPAAVIRRFQTEPVELNVDFNKVDLNVGYAMVILAPEIDRRDRKLISALSAEKMAGLISLNYFYDGFSAAEFVRFYYMRKFSEDGAMIRNSILDDYVRMSLEAGSALRIGFGKGALIRAHDELSIQNRKKANARELKRPLITVPSRFDGLEKAILDSGAKGLERIRTTERLFEEGVYQHNCVFSRRQLVRQDNASIYHWDHDGASYTIQFIIDRLGYYQIEEIRARFNEPASREHLRVLQRLLRGFCAVDAYQLVDEELPRPYPRFDIPDADAMLDDLPF